MQMANWQRAGGKGGKPTPVKRPDDKPQKKSRKAKWEPQSADELSERRLALKERLKRKAV